MRRQSVNDWVYGNELLEIGRRRTVRPEQESVALIMDIVRKVSELVQLGVGDIC